MPSDAQLLEEISRLQTAISRKTQHVTSSYSKSDARPPTAAPYRVPTHEVVIDGVTFQASGKSLIRKTVTSSTPQVSNAPVLRPIPPNSFASTSTATPPEINMVRTKKGSLIAANRIRKLHQVSASRGNLGATRMHYRGAAKRGRGRPTRPNLALRHPNNGRTRIKRFIISVDKPCRHFTTRGVCNNGLNCRYKHNPDHVAICPRFLNDECPNSAETCLLSHVPTPERVPLCVHFANGGRCRNGSSCKYPHVRMGPKDGVCRDFAVLGFCPKGLDCAHQHVRECPDFAATGMCPTKGCKLPHVIRARHKRTDATEIVSDSASAKPAGHSAANGDEFISLTFDESSEDDEEDNGENSEDEESDDSRSEASKGETEAMDF